MPSLIIIIITVNYVAKRQARFAYALLAGNSKTGFTVVENPATTLGELAKKFSDDDKHLVIYYTRYGYAHPTSV